MQKGWIITKNSKFNPFIDFLFKSSKEHGVSADISHEQMIFQTKDEKYKWDSETLKNFKIRNDGFA